MYTCAEQDINPYASRRCTTEGTTLTSVRRVGSTEKTLLLLRRLYINIYIKPYYYICTTSKEWPLKEARRRFEY